MKEVGRTWKIGDLYIVVTKDSEDYTKTRMGELGVLDALVTVPHFMGTESFYRNLDAYIMSGYDSILLGMIETSGYYTLVSDQGGEGNYYIIACNPTRKEAINKQNEVYFVKLELRKESTA